MPPSSASCSRSRRAFSTATTASPTTPPTATPTSPGCGPASWPFPSSSRRPSVPVPCAFDYAVVRVVPHVEREEFINAGVIVFCPEQHYLAARVELDDARLLAL